MTFTDPVTLREWQRDAERVLSADGAALPLAMARRVERLVEENLELRRLLESKGEDF